MQRTEVSPSTWYLFYHDKCLLRPISGEHRLDPIVCDVRWATQSHRATLSTESLVFTLEDISVKKQGNQEVRNVLTGSSILISSEQ